jgi:hypothetical protein
MRPETLPPIRCYGSSPDTITAPVYPQGTSRPSQALATRDALTASESSAGDRPDLAEREKGGRRRANSLKRKVKALSPPHLSN